MSVLIKGVSVFDNTSYPFGDKCMRSGIKSCMIAPFESKKSLLLSIYIIFVLFANVDSILFTSPLKIVSPSYLFSVGSIPRSNILDDGNFAFNILRIFLMFLIKR